MSSALCACEMLAHQPAQLVVAQIVEVVDIFEIARHGFTRVSSVILGVARAAHVRR